MLTKVKRSVWPHFFAVEAGALAVLMGSWAVLRGTFAELLDGVLVWLTLAQSVILPCCALLFPVTFGLNALRRRVLGRGVVSAALVGVLLSVLLGSIVYYVWNYNSLNYMQTIGCFIFAGGVGGLVWWLFEARMVGVSDP